MLRHNADVAFKMQLQLLRLRTSDYKLCDFDKLPMQTAMKENKFYLSNMHLFMKIENKIGEANCNFVVDILCFFSFGNFYYYYYCYYF